jgi:hypothetical protein
MQSVAIEISAWRNRPNNDSGQAAGVVAGNGNQAAAFS